MRVVIFSYVGLAVRSGLRGVRRPTELTRAGELRQASVRV